MNNLTKEELITLIHASESAELSIKLVDIFLAQQEQLRVESLSREKRLKSILGLNKPLKQ